MAGDLNAVHPRVRGEHGRSSTWSSPTGGSSPRPRGTPKGLKGSRHVDRFIPASAGNTSAPRHPRCARSVHPRVRGEHEVWPRPEFYPAGSSPRPRGTPGRSKSWRDYERFIPASAGNTRTSTPRSGSWAVHPRVRGEHALAASKVPPCDGSSPRPRGTLTNIYSFLFRDRFIPASAGNTARGTPPGIP